MGGSDESRTTSMDLGDKIGTVFGKGSRNNFLNFFGSLIANLADLAAVASLGVRRRGDAIDSVRKKFSEAESFAEGLGASFAELVPVATQAGSRASAPP